MSIRYAKHAVAPVSIFFGQFQVWPVVKFKNICETPKIMVFLMKRGREKFSINFYIVGESLRIQKISSNIDGP